MRKTVKVTTTFLFEFTKADLGLDEDISDEEFEAAIEEYMKHDIDYSSFEPNDIEMEVY